MKPLFKRSSSSKCSYCPLLLIFQAAVKIPAGAQQAHPGHVAAPLGGSTFSTASLYSSWGQQCTGPRWLQYPSLTSSSSWSRHQPCKDFSTIAKYKLWFTGSSSEKFLTSLFVKVFISMQVCRTVSSSWYKRSSARDTWKRPTQVN